MSWNNLASKNQKIKFKFLQEKFALRLLKQRMEASKRSEVQPWIILRSLDVCKGSPGRVEINCLTIKKVLWRTQRKGVTDTASVGHLINAAGLGARTRVWLQFRGLERSNAIQNSAVSLGISFPQSDLTANRITYCLGLRPPEQLGEKNDCAPSTSK
ncbi:hypothetical protein O181_031388 [Austropuccinia psidii MF-1]|uniref:Uncharacterized protein n=1 Tax=Austropuccinia psidii MF-1 TaxID=1389203 RepID=A0A9Q3CXD1_9BASI|nr:hypothetical protein [Austropuccinia psidii MF-1]